MRILWRLSALMRFGFRTMPGGSLTARASIEVLPESRPATPPPLIFDSGVEGGLDILWAIALGADFVMLGRAFHFALAALGADGPPYLIKILTKDMESNMGQMGATALADLPDPVPLSPHNSGEF